MPNPKEAEAKKHYEQALKDFKSGCIDDVSCGFKNLLAAVELDQDKQDYHKGLAHMLKHAKDTSFPFSFLPEATGQKLTLLQVYYPFVEGTSATLPTMMTSGYIKAMTALIKGGIITDHDFIQASISQARRMNGASLSSANPLTSEFQSCFKALEACFTELRVAHGAQAAL